ncbi:hypothetical protein CsSME_00031898 [Camellia sinensis var. sinensis]
MEVLAVVQNYLVNHATVDKIEAVAELVNTKTQLSQFTLELEVARRRVVSLEFKVMTEQRKSKEVHLVCTTAKERLEEALTNNEELRESSLKKKEEADARVAEFERALVAERKALEEEMAMSTELAKTLASEKAAYPNLYGAIVEQFK